MKKIIVLFCVLISLKAFSQNADTSDFFRVGLYGGSLVSPSYTLVEKNKYLNSISLETEYVKFKFLSFYVRGIYQFTNLYLDNNYETLVETPSHYHIAVSFGAKYYLADKNIKPYLKLGLNHETDYIDSYTVFYNGGGSYNTRGNWNYYYSLNFGVGLNVRLNNKFSADIQYDLYRNFLTEYDYFRGFSVLAGIKYNIFY